MNATANQIRPVGFETAAERSLSHGDITQAALDRVGQGATNRRAKEMADRALLAAGGIPTLTVAPSDKDIRREKLLSFVQKAVAPERLIPLLCIGAAKGDIRANDGLWLAQQVVNAACMSAVQEYRRLKQTMGILAGVDFEADEASIFKGLHSSNIQVGGRDNREMPNIFSICEFPEVVESTFKEWYAAQEVALSALAGASTDATGGPMQYGQFSRWEGEGRNLRQVVETFEDRVATAMANENVAEANPKDDIWAKFKK